MSYLLQVERVRLPHENGNFKGFGYIEFSDRNSLLEALKRNEELINKRPVRIDIADNQNRG